MNLEEGESTPLEAKKYVVLSDQPEWDTLFCACLCPGLIYGQNESMLLNETPYCNCCSCGTCHLGSHGWKSCFEMCLTLAGTLCIPIGPCFSSLERTQTRRIEHQFQVMLDSSNNNSASSSVVQLAKAHEFLNLQQSAVETEIMSRIITTTSEDENEVCV